jgi:hypothetical protein
MLKRNEVLPGREAEIRVRVGAGGADLQEIAAGELGIGRDQIHLDGPGQGTCQAGAMASLASFIINNRSGELLLLGREIDEVGFIHYKIA